MLASQILECVVDLFGGDKLLVDPTDCAACRFHVVEAAAVLHHLEFVAVLDRCRAIRYSGYPVAQEGLLGGDIDILCCRSAMQMGAPHEEDEQEKAETGNPQPGTILGSRMGARNRVAARQGKVA